MQHSLAPVVLFAYARPEHTRRALEALAVNALAKQSDLIVYADAARNEMEVERVQAVRAIVHAVSGFRSVTVVERETNYGLARNIIEGVTEVCNCHDRVIVLEDDLVTSKYFLRYMNESLDLYQHEERVMHVSGSSYPIEKLGRQEDTYFLRVPLCWGWGTWRRAWAEFKKDLSVMQRFDAAMIRSFNFDHTYNYWEQMEFNREEKINTWFVFWYAQVFLRNGLSLFPACSMAQNIGHDGSGVHCGYSDLFDVELCAQPIKLSAIPIEESFEAIEAHKRYFKRISPNIATRIFRRMGRLVLAMGE